MTAEARGDRLAAAVAEAGSEALLVTDLVNVRWLTGFAGSNGACLCGPDHRVLLTDFRYAEVAAAGVEGWEVSVVGGEWLAGLVEQLAGRLAGGAARIGYEDDRLTVRSLRRIEQALAERGDARNVELIAAGGTVERLRRVKDADEIERIAAAAELTDSVYRATLEHGLAGRTELEIARFALAQMRDAGAEPSFPPIVATGPNGALPHAVPGDRFVEAGDLVVFDMGAELDGVCSDCTRTFAIGRPAPDRIEAYETVLAAQAAGLGALRAGAGGREVDAAARAVIEAAGMAERFGHGLGHGVGLEVHESPRLSPHSEDTLVAGDVVTVEPGVYIPGEFGVRIEDLIVVETDGYRNLSGLDKELHLESSP